MKYFITAVLVFLVAAVNAQPRFDAPIMPNGGMLSVPNVPRGGTLPIPNDPNLPGSNKLMMPKSDPLSLSFKNSKTEFEPTVSEYQKREQVYDPKYFQMSEGKANDKIYKTFQRDQDLGDVSTSSGSIRISCRDHEYVDGDRIRIYFNDAVLVPNLTLRGDYTYFDIKLADGFNTLDFEALNEGSSSPNTAELKIYDDAGQLLCGREWNIATGFKASVLVVKK